MNFVVRWTLFILVLLHGCTPCYSAIVDYGPPQDVLGHWLFDIYDASGNERGTNTNPLYVGQFGTWTVGRSWTLLNSTDSVTAFQGGAPWSSNITQLAGASFSATNWIPTRITNGTAYVDPTQIRPLTSGTDSIAVTGTITATNSANGNTGAAVPVQATQVGGSDGTNLRALKVSTTGVLSVDGSAVTQPISAVALPLPGGAATSALQTTGNSSLSSIDAKTPALGQALMAASSPVVIASNQSAIPASQSGVWTTGRTWTAASGTDSITAVQGGAWTVTANAGTNLNTSLLALDTSVNGILLSQGSATSGQKGPLIQGSVSTSAPSYTSAQTSPLSLTTAGALRTDASASIQPVSQSGAWTVAQGSANTSANGWPVKLTDGTDNAEIKAANTAAVAADPALVVTLSPNTSAGANIGTKVPLTANAPFAVSVGTSTTTVLAANASRKGLTLVNNSAAKVYIAFGTAAVLGSGILLLPGGVFYMDEYSYSQAAVNGIASLAASSTTGQEFQ